LLKINEDNKLNITDAINTVRQELIDEGGMLYKIALNKGIDENAVDKLMEALNFLVLHYKDAESIPKKLAAAFIDITPLFERSISMYSETDQERIEDIRNDIVSLAEDIFFDG